MCGFVCCRFVSILGAVANALEVALVAPISTDSTHQDGTPPSSKSSSSSKLSLIDLVQRDYGLVFARSVHNAMDPSFAHEPQAVSKVFNQIARYATHSRCHVLDVLVDALGTCTGGWAMFSAAA